MEGHGDGTGTSRFSSSNQSRTKVSDERSGPPSGAQSGVVPPSVRIIVRRCPLGTPPPLTTLTQLTRGNGSSASIAAARSEWSACQRSQSCCRPSQKSATHPGHAGQPGCVIMSSRSPSGRHIIGKGTSLDSNSVSAPPCQAPAECSSCLLFRQHRLKSCFGACHHRHPSLSVEAARTVRVDGEIRVQLGVCLPRVIV